MDLSFKSLQCKNAHPPELTVEGILKAEAIIKQYSSDYFTFSEVEAVPAIPALVNQPTVEDCNKMLSFFGIDYNKKVKCPHPNCMYECVMLSMIPHLNDSGCTYSTQSKMDKYGISSVVSYGYENHRWTFKQIGKWLEELGY